MGYTELDAIYDIVVWQIPVPFVFAALLLMHQLNDTRVSLYQIPVFYSVYVVIFTIPIAVFDLLVFPPMLALIRYTGVVFTAVEC